MLQALRGAPQPGEEDVAAGVLQRRASRGVLPLAWRRGARPSAGSRQAEALERAGTGRQAGGLDPGSVAAARFAGAACARRSTRIAVLGRAGSPSSTARSGTTGSNESRQYARRQAICLHAICLRAACLHAAGDHDGAGEDQTTPSGRPECESRCGSQPFDGRQSGASAAFGSSAHAVQHPHDGGAGGTGNGDGGATRAGCCSGAGASASSRRAGYRFVPHHRDSRGPASASSSSRAHPHASLDEQ